MKRRVYKPEFILGEKKIDGSDGRMDKNFSTNVFAFKFGREEIFGEERRTVFSCVKYAMTCVFVYIGTCVMFTEYKQ